MKLEARQADRRLHRTPNPKAKGFVLWSCRCRLLLHICTNLQAFVCMCVRGCKLISLIWTLAVWRIDSQVQMGLLWFYLLQVFDVLGPLRRYVCVWGDNETSRILFASLPLRSFSITSGEWDALWPLRVQSCPTNTHTVREFTYVRRL